MEAKSHLLAPSLFLHRYTLCLQKGLVILATHWHSLGFPTSAYNPWSGHRSSDLVQAIVWEAWREGVSPYGMPSRRSSLAL